MNRNAKLLATITLGLGLLHPALTRAQSTEKSVEVQLFQNAIGPRGFLTLDSARVPAHKLYGLGLMFNYQKSPFSLETVGTAGRVNVIDDQLTGEFGAAVGLFDKFQLGIAIPLTLMLDGEDFTKNAMASGRSISGAGLGDIRIEGKYLITQRSLGQDGEDGELFFAVIGGLTAPSGSTQKFLGDKTVTGRVKLVGEYVVDKFRGAAMLGALLRDSTKTFAAEIGHQLMYGAAAEYSLHRQVAVLAEWFGRNGFSNYVDEAPMEVDVAMRLNVTSMLSFTLGGGAGVLKGVGAPKFRAFLGANFHPDFRDADTDGVYDLDDRCPDSQEDRDGFKDRDGCPELDNDGDAMFDAVDKCPNEGEDVDQFQDEDGCPEADNDKDGVPDLNDPCPNAAEDGAGARPKDGCPSTTEDVDGDGTVDSKDKCADEPEDRDGFEDDDGCPDLDNDADGIPDQFDSCPAVAEDADGFEDEDGCPEADNDKDGFPDQADKCAAEPETLNGNKDDDGCPDPGAEVVTLTETTIEVRERIAFTTEGSIALRPAGQAIVALVGLVLKGHPELASVRINVTADSETDAKARAEAIKTGLVAVGVDGARVNTTGKAGRSAITFVVEAVKDAKPAPGAPAK